MLRNRYVVGSIVLAVLLLAGCGGNPAPVSPAPADPPEPTSSAAARQEPTRLIGMWAVTGRGVEADTVLRLADNELLVFRGCEILSGAWRADQSGLFLADVHGSSPGGKDRCAPDGRPQAPDWLARAGGFRTDGDSPVLVDADGTELVRLRPGAKPQAGPDVYKPWLEAPTVTEQARRLLAPAPALPGDLVAPDRGALVGRWLPETGPGGGKPARGSNRPEAPYVELAADGTWRASDGCNNTGGRWAAGAAGALLATGGPSTLIGCNNVPVGSWLSSARQAGFDGEVLVLRDAQGKETGRLRPA